jgi:hypothetical protein
VEAERGALGGSGARDHTLIEKAARLTTIHDSDVLTRQVFNDAIEKVPSDTPFDSLCLF